MSTQKEKTQSKKKFTKVLKIAAFVFLAFIGLMVVLFLTMGPKNLKVENVDLTSISDGVYDGHADNGLVKVKVAVKVTDNTIQKIDILEHVNGLGKPAEKIVDDIIAQQSLEVDAVASATYSSDTIRKAVENALQKGNKESVE